MSDTVRDSLENIRASILLIQCRFVDIQTADQLLSDADGLLTLDSIAMRLRDIISHHYDALDHEIIFSACKDSIPELQSVIELMVKDASTD